MAKAEIISIGDEILIGQITNTNAQWMAQQLNLIGIAVTHLITVGDNKKDMLQAFSDAQKRSEIILITGGLGPTSDDLTKPALCEFFGSKLIFNNEVFEMVKKRFASFNIYMPESNRGQAEVPENCTVIKNNNGTAPGMWFNSQNTIFVSLPGVPYEMKAMMEEFVLPELKQRFQKESIVHKTVYTQGVGESTLAEKIKDWEKSLTPLHIKLAYLPSPSQVKLRLSVQGTNKQQLTILVDEKIAELRKLIPELIFAVEEYGKEPESLEKTIGELLRKNHQTLAVAESCTGGYIGHLITSIAGSSDYFNGGIIAYANDIKINVLKVDATTLETKDAVSKEVVEQMAMGVKQRLKADYGIATTGIAGPTGGSAEKPVGTVWIAVAADGKVISEKYSFGDNRERTIRRAGLSALNMLRTTLEFHA